MGGTTMFGDDLGGADDAKSAKKADGEVKPLLRTCFLSNAQ
jgi:hypothetical protein